MVLGLDILVDHKADCQQIFNLGRRVHRVQRNQTKQKIMTKPNQIKIIYNIKQLSFNNPAINYQSFP